MLAADTLIEPVAGGTTTGLRAVMMVAADGIVKVSVEPVRLPAVEPLNVEPLPAVSTEMYEPTPTVLD